MIDGLTATLRSQGMSPSDAAHHAYARAAALLAQQASTLAYTDVISGLTVIVACLAPLCFIMKRPPKGLAAPSLH